MARKGKIIVVSSLYFRWWSSSKTLKQDVQNNLHICAGKQLIPRMLIHYLFKATLSSLLFVQELFECELFLWNLDTGVPNMLCVWLRRIYCQYYPFAINLSAITLYDAEIAQRHSCLNTKSNQYLQRMCIFLERKVLNLTSSILHSQLGCNFQFISSPRKILLQSHKPSLSDLIWGLMNSNYNPAPLQIKTVPVAFEELLQMTDPSSKDFLENILFVFYFCCVFLCHLALLIAIINAMIFILTTKRK